MSIDVMKQALEALEALWQIIDEIDTASDMAKDNDVWYRERVQHLQQKRWQLGITTDGNKLEGGAMDALRSAIDQSSPLPPPPECKTEAEKIAYAFGWYKALETHRAPKRWQGLTDEEIAIIMVQELGVDEDIDAMSCFAHAIEAKLKEKNK